MLAASQDRNPDKYFQVIVTGLAHLGELFCPDVSHPQELSSKIHHLPRNYFQTQCFHPVMSLKQDGRSPIFCCPQGQLVQPCFWKVETRSNQPESYPENTNKKMNLAETSAAVPEDGQHPSNIQSSCLWLAWHKNEELLGKKKSLHWINFYADINQVIFFFLLEVISYHR